MMDFLRHFISQKSSSAKTARERLQIVVAHQRSERDIPDFLPKLQQEILQVVRKYVAVTEEDIDVNIAKSGLCSVLEVNLTLPNTKDKALR